MIKKLSAIGLLTVFIGIPAAAGDRDDDIFYKFLLYTQNVYLPRAMQNLDPDDTPLAMAGKLFSARVLGYSLSNLLQFARRGSENHQIWQMLERRSKEAMFDLIDLQGAQERWDRIDIEKSKQNALNQFRGALQNWYDTSLVGLTGVRPEEAPNFFETLAAPPPAPPAPPVEPPAPPVQPPTPPTPHSADGVAGIYRVTGKSEYDANPGASFVKLSGSMDEVEAEFKLFSGVQVTWDYKGKATWDGREGNNIRDLKGKTQWLTYPHIIHDLTLRITRGADGVWRAESINIGGNLFQLAQTRSVERPIPAAAKTLTIKNTTAGRITVYLDNVEIGLKNDLGTVEPRSERIFSGIPERGRWYLKIVPAPDTYPKIHVSMLYIKDAESAYVHEVLTWHLK